MPLFLLLLHLTKAIENQRGICGCSDSISVHIRRQTPRFRKRLQSHHIQQNGLSIRPGQFSIPVRISPDSGGIRRPKRRCSGRLPGRQFLRLPVIGACRGIRRTHGWPPGARRFGGSPQDTSRPGGLSRSGRAGRRNCGSIYGSRSNRHRSSHGFRCSW